jgi:hypothetical protein
VLLKAVIQAIPTYTMSVFQIPKALTKDINAMMGKFWWSFKDNSSKIAWMAWRRMGRSKNLGGLGYRDIDCFNTALLAKQCWRLLKNPDSLAARVMRGKYFPNSDFLGSNLGKKASYAWRSIWQAKGLLQEGLLWRVGNGSRINLWDDRWIPDPPHNILDKVRALPREATVADIISREANWWDVPLIKNIFSEETVDRICSIPINPRFHEDKLIWRGTKKGGFSVRSAYHLEMERRDREKGSSSSVHSDSHLWRRLWSLKLPRHILLFLWRACNEILPTKNNLFKRKVVTDQLCPMCGSEAESVSHALWRCGSAQAIWGSCRGPIQKCSTGAEEFLRVFADLCDKLDDRNLEYFGAVAHKIWSRRNRVVFGGAILPPNILIREVFDLVEEFRTTNSRVETLGQGEQSTRIGWSKPAENRIKINWDAALDGGRKLMGIGIIARDHQGRVRAAKCEILPHVRDPVAAEAIGARSAVSFGCFMGFQTVDLEGETREIILTLSNPEEVDSVHGHFLAETRQMLGSLASWKVSHVRREGNKAAHSLAKLALSKQCNQVWINSCPSELVCVVNADI